MDIALKPRSRMKTRRSSCTPRERPEKAGILLNCNFLRCSAPEAMKHFIDLTDKDVKLAAIPLSHIRRLYLYPEFYPL